MTRQFISTKYLINADSELLKQPLETINNTLYIY